MKTTGFANHKVIPLTAEYLDQICALENLCFTVPWSRELIANELSQPVSLARGIIAAGSKFAESELVAYSFNHLIVDELHILSLAVSADNRRLGFGRWLLNSILEEARAAAANYAILEVRASNTAALQLYKSLDFKYLGRRRHYYSDNGEDAAVFARDL